jgi:DNA-binding NtrC family response regulator
MLRVLILEKDQYWRKVLSDALTTFYEIDFCSHGKNVFDGLKSDHYNAIILDLQIEQEDPFKLLRWITTTMPHNPVIITSQTEKAELVVKAVKQGACDFIVKPFSPARIRHAVQQALENRGLKNEIDYLRHEQDVIYNFDEIIALSPVMKETINTLKKFSKTDSTILMTGETGTGKSFLSGAIHFNSHRRKKPFIKINCANIPETLLESELFGHEKGAFTGAEKLRIGRFEQAHGGTLFLDEIGETSLSIQAKLLRVLEERAFERVGGNQTIHSDVRVIAATNRDLARQIEAGKFRQDLYYRINILSARLPPLRERKQCLEPLANYLLGKICTSLKRRAVRFSPESIDWISACSWPGNIRQLANNIERAVILEEGSIIQKKSLLLLEPVDPAHNQKVANPPQPLEAREKEIILKALQGSLWIQKDAAKLLGISPRTLNYKINKFGITHPRWRRNI